MRTWVPPLRTHIKAGCYGVCEMLSQKTRQRAPAHSTGWPLPSIMCSCTHRHHSTQRGTNRWAWSGMWFFLLFNTAASRLRLGRKLEKQIPFCAWRPNLEWRSRKVLRVKSKSPMEESQDWWTGAQTQKALGHKKTGYICPRVCVCVCNTCVQVPMEARRGVRPPGTGATGTCELPR